MKRTVDLHEFRESFKRMGRENQFSYDGLGALFNHLEEIERDTGEEVELDVIGLCCDFMEYDSLEALKEDYQDIETMDDLNDRTFVIPIEGDRFIIQQF